MYDLFRARSLYYYACLNLQALPFRHDPGSPVKNLHDADLVAFAFDTIESVAATTAGADDGRFFESIETEATAAVKFEISEAASMARDFLALQKHSCVLGPLVVLIYSTIKL